MKREGLKTVKNGMAVNEGSLVHAAVKGSGDVTDGMAAKDGMAANEGSLVRTAVKNMQSGGKAMKVSVKGTGRKTQSIRKTMEKRWKQYQRVMTLAKVAVRLLNALDHSTIYRKKR